jgi:hypothetical protein
MNGNSQGKEEHGESKKRKGGAGYEAGTQRHGPLEHLELAVTVM